MKHSKVLLTLPTLLVASTFFGGVPSLSALTLVVNNAAPVETSTATCPKSMFTTIGAALTYSRSGDLVYVCAGIYPEQINITDSITVAGQTGAEIQPSTFVANGIDVNDAGSPLAAAVMVTPDPNNPSLTPVVVFYNFIVDGSNAPAGCSPSFAGIVYQDASGTIADNAVTNIQVPGGGNGCQTGLAIYVEGSASTTPTVTVAQNSVHDYQKNGITVAGGVGLTATVEYNYVRGYGPASFIAQNGIEFDSGTGAITSNTVSGNIYTGPNYQSTNILIFTNGIPVTSNIIKDGDTAVYVYAGVTGTLVTKNSISNTTYDGVYFPDGSVTSNIVVDSQERAGGFAIEYYGTGSATATTNTILDANIGVAVDNTGATVTTTGNKYFATLVPTSNLGGGGGAPNRPAKRAVSPVHK